MPEEKIIEHYVFSDFVRALESAVAEGFRVDWKSNGAYPIGMIGSYRVGVVRGATTEEAPKEPAKRGRPSKSKE